MVAALSAASRNGEPRLPVSQMKGKTPQKAERYKRQVAGGCWSLFGKDGNQRDFSFFAQSVICRGKNSIALLLKINNVFRSYLDLVQSG